MSFIYANSKIEPTESISTVIYEGGKRGGGLDHISREIKQPFHNSQKMK